MTVEYDDAWADRLRDKYGIAKPMTAPDEYDAFLDEAYEAALQLGAACARLPIDYRTH